MRALQVQGSSPNVFSAEQIASITGGRLEADPTIKVTAQAVLDSRAAQPGSLFVAAQGENVDGHDYARGALENGATLVLGTRSIEGVPVVVVEDIEQALGLLAQAHLRNLRQQGDIRVVGITGSAGKTTTKDLIGQILSEHGSTIFPAGSFNNELGLPLTVLRATPETRYLVLEMGASAPGDLTYLTHIAPLDVAVVLIVGSAHLGGFGGGIDDVARAKSELVQGVVAGGTVILNADDLRVIAMKDQASEEVLTYGVVRDTTFHATETHIDALGRSRFTVTDTRTSETEEVHLQLVGEHHMTNALAALAATTVLGINLNAAVSTLNNATALSPHRMDVTERPDGITIIDDSYNANPDSMRAALKALAVIAGRKRRTVAVLGEMLELGENSREQHDDLGRIVVRLNISLLVVVGAGASGIADGAMQEGSWGDEVVEVPTIEEAETFLTEYLTEGDVVLVKSSKGSGLWKLADRLVGKA
ncbi:UDP-N-acetylmuramoyl-tripeptide--D-alanyl-D-alanine ligase [Timonella sp. A28]|uniref:UDP-N-acetylmuramoyl-tripeptide--D-alanyl-D- alanine ligase n=1 Tax=Timonella sp. A28 TaxID=3442640 RepID=UPI003EBC780A